MKVILIFLCVIGVAYVKATSEPVDIIKISNNAVDECVEDVVEREKIRGLIFKPVLPEDDVAFVKVYECICRKTHVLDEDGHINYDVVRAIFPEIIRRKISDKVDADKLTHDGIEFCQKENVSGSPGLIAIKLRNCVTVLFGKIYTHSVDVIKLSNDAVHHCAINKEAEEHLKDAVFNPILPEDDDDFIEFYECFCKRLHILDENGIMDLDVVRVIYSDYIKKKISSTVDAMQLTNDAINHCEKIPVGKPLGLYAMKRRNCGNKFITDRLK
ncbi:hypothetical protein FQR65_LT07885 [Abscondita terminalis]|nr:hypothetical protein FQR65_LT07885 [Abscondita terminalis]